MFSGGIERDQWIKWIKYPKRLVQNDNIIVKK